MREGDEHRRGGGFRIRTPGRLLGNAPGLTAKVSGRPVPLAFGLLLLISFPFSFDAGAQTLTPAPSITINTQALFTSGTTAAYSGQISFNPVATLGASIAVNASGASLTSGSNTLPANLFTIQVTGTTGLNTSGQTFTPVTLSTTSQTMYSSGLALSLLGTVTFSLSYKLAGGVSLLVPAGTYTTSLTFTITRLGPLGINLGTATVSTTLTVIVTNVQVLVIQNGGGTASLSYSSASSYTNGVSLTQTSALNAFSNTVYSVYVNASQNLKNGINFIPIGNVTVTPNANPAAAGITTSAVPLSLSMQKAVAATVPSLSQNFDLLYATPAAGSAFLGMPAGTYTTVLTYTITNP